MGFGCRSEVVLNLARSVRRNDSFSMRCAKLVLLYFALSSFGLARIGDTLDECKARYGEAIHTGTDSPNWDSPIHDERPWFIFDSEVEGVPMRIRATFEDAKVVKISYRPKSGQRLTYDQAMGILEAHGERKNWQMGYTPEIGESPLGYVEAERYLNNKKDKLYAMAGTPEGDWRGLTIFSTAFLRRHGQWDDARNNYRDWGELCLKSVPEEYPQDKARLKARIEKAWADLEAKYGAMGRRP
jgi:hypothetical protein